MAISSPGIGSNLDVNGIISKLMAVEAQPLTALQKKEASYQAQLSAFGNLSGSLGSFQTSLETLNNPATFQTLDASSSDSSIFTSTASSTASAGTYSLNVTQLAQAQSLAAVGRASSTATIGTGATTKLTIQFGSITGGQLVNGKYVTDSGATPQNPTFAQDPNKASGVITIDNTNNSLQGIRDAINKANLGVTATIVSDGSSSPYRLVLTSNDTGASSSMKITTDGADATLDNLLSYDPAGTQNLTQNTAAQNANVTLNGIAITSKTNLINNAIDGVTVNLAKTGNANLTVARNTSAIQSGVNAMVKAYNDLNSMIKSLTSYDPSTKAAGILLGDSSVRNIQTQIRAMMSSTLTGSSSSLKTLSQVGISMQKDGSLSVDSSKLSTAMTKNLSDVAALFSSVGKSSDSLVSYTSSTSSTTPGDHPVYITSLATQGKAVGSTVLASTVINNTNKDLAVTIDGVTASVSLVPNASAYTPSQLAAQVQAAINGASQFSSAGIAVSAMIDGSGHLTITSNKYGSTSKVTVAGSAATSLLGTPVSTDGADVVGKIDGVVATGSGQYLTAATGSPSSGLKLQITGGAENSGRGSVNFSQGFAFKLNKLIEGFVGTSGVIAGRQKGINNTIKSVQDQVDTMNERLVDMEARYRKQYTALDVTISSMGSTSSFLTQQLELINNQTKAAASS